MDVKVKVSILNDCGDPFMGAGPLWLLERIRKLKSISQAAMDMNMSYAKAHRILKRLEENIGEKMLVTKMGGMERGGAKLTPFAEEFLKIYNRYQETIRDYAERKFSDFLAEIERIKPSISP